LDLASRLRERPGAGADGGQVVHREDAKGNRPNQGFPVKRFGRIFRWPRPSGD
jgi:hypothetical protein